MSRMDELQWANRLREAADDLEAGSQGDPGPSGAMYARAKSIVDRVSDQMYVAHLEAAKKGWDRALGKGAERVG